MALIRRATPEAMRRATPEDVPAISRVVVRARR